MSFAGGSDRNRKTKCGVSCARYGAMVSDGGQALIITSPERAELLLIASRDSGVHAHILHPKRTLNTYRKRDCASNKAFFQQRLDRFETVVLRRVLNQQCCRRDAAGD